MKKFCCGKTRQSKFCPECGRELSDATGTIESLLSYCASRAASSARAIASHEKQLKHSDRKDWHTSCIEKLKPKLKWWQEVSIALASLMDQQEARNAEDQEACAEGAEGEQVGDVQGFGG